MRWDASTRATPLPCTGLPRSTTRPGWRGGSSRSMWRITRPPRLCPTRCTTSVSTRSTVSRTKRAFARGGRRRLGYRAIVAAYPASRSRVRSRRRSNPVIQMPWTRTTASVTRGPGRRRPPGSASSPARSGSARSAGRAGSRAPCRWRFSRTRSCTTSASSCVPRKQVTASAGVSTIGSPAIVERGVEQDRHARPPVEGLEQRVQARVRSPGAASARGPSRRRGRSRATRSRASGRTRFTSSMKGDSASPSKISCARSASTTGRERPEALPVLHLRVHPVPHGRDPAGSARMLRLPSERGPNSLRPWNHPTTRPRASRSAVASTTSAGRLRLAARPAAGERTACSTSARGVLATEVRGGHRERARALAQRVRAVQRAAERDAVVPGGRLDEHVLEGRLLQDAGVRDAVERHATREAEIRRAGLARAAGGPARPAPAPCPPGRGGRGPPRPGGARWPATRRPRGPGRDGDASAPQVADPSRPSSKCISGSPSRRP